MIHKIIWTDNASTLQKNMNRQHAGIQGKGGHIQEKVLFYVFLHQFEFSKGGGGGTNPHSPSRSEHAQTAKDYQIINIFIMFIYHRHLTLYIFLIIKNTYLHKILNDILGTGYIFFMMRKISTQCYA